LHRDIDPQNVYLRADGSRPGRRAILIDFGAAREAVGQRSQSLSVILKPGYAPPEQYRPSGNHGPWTDIYACAATLYKCLTGLKPPVATDRTQSDELVPPSEISGEVSLETDLAVRKGLALDPERRPSSATKFAELLRRAQGDDDTAGGPAQSPNTRAGEAREGPAALSVQGPTAAEGTSTGAESSGMAGSTEGSPPSRATGSAQRADERSRGWSLAMLTAGMAGAVGAGVAFSDAGFGQILAFFGTWIAVCGGLIGLFLQGERLMRPESRAAISDWLLGEDFAEKVSGWPETFTGLFDAVFSDDHFSWTCFWRSALVSVLTVGFFFTGALALGIPLSAFPGGDYVGVLKFIALGSVLNTVVDYFSLYETRWVLGRMSHSKHAGLDVAYLVLDLILTQTIFAFGVAVVLLGTTLVFAPPEGTEISLLNAPLFGFFGGYAIFYDLSSFSPTAYSTLFTSLWVWLYVGAGFLLRILQPILESLDWIKHLLDVERRPAETIGLLLAVLASVSFAISAPFAL
jgi:Serine/threonine protein kinase